MITTQKQAFASACYTTAVVFLVSVIWQWLGDYLLGENSLSYNLGNTPDLFAHYIIPLLANKLILSIVLVLMFNFLTWPFVAWSRRRSGKISLLFYLPAVLLFYIPFLTVSAFLVGSDELTYLWLLLPFVLLIPMHWLPRREGRKLGPLKQLLIWVILWTLAGVVQFSLMSEAEKKAADAAEQARQNNRMKTPAEHIAEVAALFNEQDQINLTPVLELLHERNGNQLVKISHDGSVLSEDALEWACVWDQSTSLLWEVKSYHEGPRHFQQRFNYGGPGQSKVVLSSSGVTNLRNIQAEAFIAIEHQPTSEGEGWSPLVTQANDESLCGRTDWQVPNLLEAMSLHNTAANGEHRKQDSWYSYADHNETRLNVAFFPYENGDTYLTSTHDDRDRARAISYREYSVDDGIHLSGLNRPYAVRLVSRSFSADPASSSVSPAEAQSSPALRLAGDNFIRDDINRLVWMRCPLGTQHQTGGGCSGTAAVLDSTTSTPAVWSHLSGLSRAELSRNWRLPSTAELQSLFACIHGKEFKASYPEQPSHAFESEGGLSKRYQEKFDSACAALRQADAESLSELFSGLYDGHYLARIDEHIGQGMAFRSQWDTGRVRLSNGTLTKAESTTTDHTRGFVLLVKHDNLNALLERTSHTEAKQLEAKVAPLLTNTAPTTRQPDNGAETTPAATPKPELPMYRVDIRNQRYHPLTSNEGIGIFMLNGIQGAQLIDLQNKLVWRYCPVYSDLAYGPGNSLGCDKTTPPEISHEEFHQHYDEIIGDNLGRESEQSADWRLPTESEIHLFYDCLNGKPLDGSPCQVVVRGIEKDNPVFYQFPDSRFLLASPRGQWIAHTSAGKINSVTAAKSGDKGLIRLVRVASTQELQRARSLLQ